MDAATRRASADANMVAAFDLVRRHSPRAPTARRVFGDVTAIASGHPLGYFNPAFVLDPATAASDVLAAVRWIEGLGLPATVRVMDGTDPAVAAGLERDGLAAGPEPETVMVLEPIPDGAPPAPPEARIRTGGRELVADWHEALGADERLRAILNAELAADPDVRIAALDVDGDLVAGALAFRWADTLGVYTVATLERARRRGYGRAVTWAAIEAGRAAWGSRVATLQSSAMGRAVYESMGFEAIGSIRVFARPKVRRTSGDLLPAGPDEP